MHRTAAAAAALAIALSAAVAHANDEWGAPPYEHPPLTINVSSIEMSGKGKIWFKLNFINNGEQAMTVDPDQIQARLADGRMMPRLKGVFDKWKHGGFTIAPHLSGDVNVEYQVGTTPRKVALVLGGVFVGGKPARLPDFIAYPADRPWGAKPYAHSGCRIAVTKAGPSGKEKVEIVMNVINDSNEPMSIDRDQIQARLPDGSLVQREKGMFDKRVPLRVAPHATAQDVSLEYKVGRPAKLELVLDGIWVSGNARLPALVVEPQ